MTERVKPHADLRAALAWVIANGFDPDGRAAWALAKLEGRPAVKEPPPRSLSAICVSLDCPRTLRHLEPTKASDAPRKQCSHTPETRAAPGPMRGNRERVTRRSK
jgi:hypothetical protein